MQFFFSNHIMHSKEIHCLIKFINCYNENKNIIFGMQTIAKEDEYKVWYCWKYTDKRQACEIRGLVGKSYIDKAPAKTAIQGRYIITPRIFEALYNTRHGMVMEMKFSELTLC